ncbi:MAG: methyltransferase [bacterium]
MTTHGDKEKRRLELSRMADGFRASHALLTAVHLGVFRILSDSPATASSIAKDLSLAQRELDLLLKALTGLDLLALDEDGRYRLHGLSDEFLRDGADGYMGDILHHNYHLMRRWARMDEVISDGKPLPRKDGRSPSELRAFILGMQNTARQSAVEVGDALDLRGVRNILDLGGGPGTYLYTLLEKIPGAEGAILDFPEVIEIAREECPRELKERVTFLEGDIFEREYKGPWDLIVISNIIHSNTLDGIRAMIGKSAAALAPGGRIMVKDFFLDVSRTVPAEAALFSLNMMISNPGRAYSEDELRHVLEAAGLDVVQRLGVGSHSGILVACKAG